MIAGIRYGSPMSERFVSVPGGRLFVVDDGADTDPPIVLLHAGIADSRSWDALVPLLVDAGYRVIRFDHRGHGRSTTDDVGFSPRADLLAVLDDAGIGRAALVGNSRGGRIAIDTAIESPDRVVAVVGVAAGLGGLETESTPEETSLWDEMDQIESADAPDPGAIVDIDLRVWVDGPGQPRDRVPAALRAMVATMDRPLYEPGHVSGSPIPLDPPAVERLADLRCPVVAVAGSLDPSDVTQAARHLAVHAPDARVVIWPHVAHMIGMEVPDELAVLIVDFLAPLPPWS